MAVLLKQCEAHSTLRYPSGIILSRAKKLVLRENKNLEVLLYINKKSFSYARDVFKRRSLESADVTTGLSSWNSNEKSKGLLPHLLGSPGVEQVLLLNDLAGFI